MNENEIEDLISRCLRHSKPQVKLYSKDDLGNYNEIRDGTVADIDMVTKELKREIGNYIRLKEAEINNKLTQVKCEAYELALTHSRPTERI